MDAFKDRKFTGVVTDVASSSKDSNQTGSHSSSSSQSQEATKFQVRIRLNDKEAFRPGMSVTADIETEYRTNVLTVPLASVTTRPPKPPPKNRSAENRRHQRRPPPSQAPTSPRLPAAMPPTAPSRRTKNPMNHQADGRGVRRGRRPREMPCR